MEPPMTARPPTVEPRSRPILPRFGLRPTAAEAFQRAGSWRQRHLWLRAALAITVAMVVLLVILANRADEQRRRTPGIFEQSGTLTSADQKYGDEGDTLDLWLVELDAGQTLRVDLQSKDFTPYFHIAGPMSLDDPQLLAQSVATSETGAHAEFSPASAGEYGLVVFSLGPAPFGSYALSSNYRLRDVWQDDIDSVEDAFGVLFVVLLLVQLSGAPIRLFWPNPDRILLLRPFGQGPVSRAMKRFNRKHLAWHGFTFTLADKYLKHSLTAYALAHVPLDLGSLVTMLYRPLFRRMHRFVFVTKPRDLALVQFRLRSRWRLGAFWQSWLGLSDRINKFRSRNELWQDCISVLLDECQVIIVDLSHVGAGTTWEVEQIFQRGYQYKALFLLHDRHDDREVAVASELLSRIVMKHGTPQTEVSALHRYSAADGSALDAAAFERAYAGAVSSDRQPTVVALPTSVKAVLAAAPTAMLGPFWSPAGLVLGLLAVRDIRRANGMLRGEILAHLAIAIHGAILCVGAVLLGHWFFTK
jgi:hypothetical protein